MALTPSQLEQFDRDGLLIIPGYFSAEEADALQTKAQKLVDDFDLSSHPKTIFKTSKDSAEQTATAMGGGMMGEAGAAASGNKNESNMLMASSIKGPADQPDYFLESADKIHYFFEEKAFNDEGELIVPRERAINKIGHYLHILDPDFSKFTNSDRVRATARSLGLIAPIVLQSMIIFKQKKIGGLVDKHRDSTFLTTTPSSAIGFWYALEHCTKDNGCLWFVPGSHKDGSNNKRFIRSGVLKNTINNVDLFAAQKDPTSIDLSVYDGPNNYNTTTEFIGRDDKLDYPESAFVCGACPKGSLVLIHGDVVHMSYPNLSEKSRNAYTFHCIDAYNTQYPQTNWLQSSMPFPHLFNAEQEKKHIQQAEEKKQKAATATSSSSS